MNFKKLSTNFRILMVRTKTIAMETFNILLFIRRFLTRHLDIRTILRRGVYVLEKFKGVYGFNFKAFGRFARRGRALELKYTRGYDVSRRYHIGGDYSMFHVPLTFGVGCLKAIFFKKPEYYFKSAIFCSSKKFNSLKS
jgi:hypothetical protein